MINPIEVVGDRIVGKVPWNKRRSPKWGKVRAAYLKEHPVCEVCGGSKGRECHHRMPFYLNPELELDPKNLITLCRKNRCHLNFGHLFSYKSYNRTIEKDALTWHNKIVSRPTERVNL